MNDKLTLKKYIYIYISEYVLVSTDIETLV